jgi:hypothetical protein
MAIAPEVAVIESDNKMATMKTTLRRIEILGCYE